MQTQSPFWIHSMDLVDPYGMAEVHAWSTIRSPLTAEYASTAASPVAGYSPATRFLHSTEFDAFYDEFKPQYSWVPPAVVPCHVPQRKEKPNPCSPRIPNRRPHQGQCCPSVQSILVDDNHEKGLKRSVLDLPIYKQRDDEVSPSSEELIRSASSIFKCCWDTCQESFTTKTGLSTHCASHFAYFYQKRTRDFLKKQKVQLRCLWRECCDRNQEFSSFRELAKHLSQETHLGQMPFIPKVEGLDDQINPHAHKNRDPTSPPPKPKKQKRYPCSAPGCGRVFNDCSNRRKHEKTHEPNRTRFFCHEDGCGKSYSTKTDLNIHMKSHRGEFPHKCTHPMCGKAFVRLSELYAHERSHDNVFPHVCLDCQKMFREKSRLKKHQEEDHQDSFFTRC